MKFEIWRPMPGIESPFLISSLGQIRHIETGQIQMQQFSYCSTGKGKAYLSFAIKINSKRTRFLVHRLVASAFIDNPENKPLVNHKDGNRLNNAHWNLEWCTQVENMEHAIKMGLRKYTKLTADHISKISGINNHSVNLVVCTKTGEVMSGLEASRRSGIPKSTLYGYLHGRQKRNKSTFVFANNVEVTLMNEL